MASTPGADADVRDASESGSKLPSEHDGPGTVGTAPPLHGADPGSELERRQDEAVKIAIVDPLGGYGIGTYTHELAEALSRKGLDVDVLTSPRPHELDALPLDYAPQPVIGSSLTGIWLSGGDWTGSSWETGDPGTEAERRAPSTGRSDEEVARGSMERLLAAVRRAVRSVLFPVELVALLRLRGYDLVWTQWPEIYGPGFWRLLRWSDLPVIHTVHNVLPHEQEPNQLVRYGQCYRTADRLVVHSRRTAEELASTFPVAEGKILPSRHGMYTVYPRQPESRTSTRRELSVEPDPPMILFFGGVRPYKNVDAVLEALPRLEELDPILVVAGEESGYRDLVPGEPLGRTRRKADALGVLDRVRLRPGPHTYRATSRLMEAADIVVLPYLKSYGSGLLMLAMTFGKHVVTTDTGGMGEYLSEYPRSTLLAGATPDEVASGLASGVRATREGGDPGGAPHGFAWTSIVDELLPHLAGLLETRTS